MPGRWSAGLVLVVAVAALMFAWAAPASAADETSVTVLTDPVVVDVTLSSPFATRSDGGFAKGTMVVSNAGAATGAGVTAYYADGTPITLAEPARIGLAGADVSSVPVRFEWTYTKYNTGWLVLSDTGPEPLTVPLEIRLVTPGWLLGLVSGLAALVAIVLTLRAAAQLNWRRKLGRTYLEGPTWTFGGSWATNLTAVGAILGSILGASGFVADVLPGVSTGLFVGFNVLYLTLIAAASVVYQACFTEEGKPRYVGLLLAGAIISWAAIGEIWTTLLMLMQGGLAWEWSLAVLIFTIVGFYYYSVASYQMATRKPPKDWVDAEGGATTAAAVTAALAAIVGQSGHTAQQQATEAARDVIKVADAGPKAAGARGAGGYVGQARRIGEQERRRYPALL